MGDRDFCDIKCPVCGCRTFSYTKVVTYTAALSEKVEVGPDGAPEVDDDGLHKQCAVNVTCMYCGTQMSRTEAILDKKQNNNKFNLV